MMNWVKKQLFEPTAWIGFLIAVATLLAAPRWFVLLLCVLAILMPEDEVKEWLAKKAPGLAAKIDNWLE